MEPKAERPDAALDAVRVVRIIARLNVGGPARHAATLDAYLRDHQVHSLLVHGTCGPAEGSLEDLVDACGLPALRIDELGRRIHVWSDVRAFWQLLRLLFRERPDVIHTHTAKAGALGRVAAGIFNASRPRAQRALVVHTFHGHVLEGYFGAAGDLSVRVAERALARLTDRIVAISCSQKEDLCHRFRVAPADRTAVIELGLDLSALLALVPDTRLRAELGLPLDAVVFTFAGRLVPIKDLHTLLDAFRLVLARVPQVRLVIAGDGEMRAPLQEAIAAARLDTFVRLTGWRRDLDTLYAGTDVGVLSSRNEGTPVAIIEAMAAGHPVVATAVGGVPDLVRDGVTGLLVPPRDKTAFAAAMERLARDAEGRRCMGDRARREVGSRFSPARLADDVNRLYRLALAEKRRHPPAPPEWRLRQPPPGGAARKGPRP